MEEECARTVQEAVERYLNGSRLEDVATEYGVPEKALYRLIVLTDPQSWLAVQSLRSII
jgi:hypothetical protein